MNYVFKNRMLLSVLLTSTALSGCSLTEFVTGKPETVQTAQTNLEQVSSEQETYTQNGSESVVRRTQIEPMPEQRLQKPAPTSTPKSVMNVNTQAETPVIKRLPAEKPRSAMNYYGSIDQPYRHKASQQGSSERYMPPIAQHSLSGAEHSVMVEEYIERVSTDLINSLANNLSDPVIGVTSFVDFNNNLTSVTPFGNRVAEHFISELQQSGFMVADYKVRDTITVNHNGDIVFSRNTDELNAAEGMTHVLAGTIMYQEKGLKIIARVVDFDNKWVVATASTFMPYFVLDTIVPSTAKQTVY